jgi:hypothetical protein
MTSYQDILGLHVDMTTEAQRLLRSKNSNYAKSDKTDALSNLKLVEAVGCCSTAHGVVARMCDKIARVSNLITKEQNSGAVVDSDNENIRDTLIDLMNYCVLLQSVLIEKRKESNEKNSLSRSSAPERNAYRVRGSYKPSSDEGNSCKTINPYDFEFESFSDAYHPSI